MFEVGFRLLRNVRRSIIQLDNTTAETTYSSLKDSLLCLGVPFDKCRGQVYDGARNFQGHISGVAKKIQDDNAAVISVHCLARCVNLCLQEVAVSSQPIKEALSFSMEMIQLIKYYPKRQVMLENIQKQQEYSSTLGIRTLCPTRWTVRTCPWIWIPYPIEHRLYLNLGSYLNKTFLPAAMLLRNFEWFAYHHAVIISSCSEFLYLMLILWKYAMLLS